jgi:hypothetical protein
MASYDLESIIQHNCNISDAQGSRMYSLCTLFLRLRSYYKWEKGLEPWDEPESHELIEWIEAKETSWQDLEDQEFLPIKIGGRTFDPFHPEPVNRYLPANSMVYGAGYGRSLKPVFFLAEKLHEKIIDGCLTFILGREMNRELAAPFAMLQDGVIYIRREPFRFYLWDQINDIRPSGKCGLRYALQCHELIDRNDRPDRTSLMTVFDSIVDQEMDIFIYHEIGEMREDAMDRELFRRIVAAFAGTPVELFVRAVKDVLADTHPAGMLNHIIRHGKKTSLGFYVTFLDGLRKLLSQEIADAFHAFAAETDWDIIERARQECRRRNRERVDRLVAICRHLDERPLESIRKELEKELLLPLGLVK